MTMGHATDRPILEEIFRQNRQFPFLGVIGSKAKRAVLVKELAAAGIPSKTTRMRSTARSASTSAPISRARSRSAWWRN